MFIISHAINTKSGFSISIALLIFLIWKSLKIRSVCISLTNNIFVSFAILFVVISYVTILVFSAKKIPNQSTRITIHDKIRGLILYRIQMICSQNSTIANRNHNTKSHDEMVHNMSKNLLLQWYMMLEIIMSAMIIAISINTHFGVFMSNIFESLLIT